MTPDPLAPEKERAAFDKWIAENFAGHQPAIETFWRGWKARAAYAEGREAAPQPTVDDTLRLLRKIALCEGDAAKLIFMKHFWEAAYLRGRAEQAKEDAELAEAWACDANMSKWQSGVLRRLASALRQKRKEGR